jgi:predicted DNA binding protein
MHEFAFAIEREGGVDRYTDLFRNHDSLQSRSVYVSTCSDRMVRLESITGDTGALEVASEAALDPSLDRESISDRSIDATRYHSVLTETSTRRIIYSYLSDIRYHDAVPVITAQYVADGTLVEAVRHGGTEQYRVLLRSDEKVGLIYDTISARIGDGVTFVFDYLERAEQWQNELLAPRALRNEQRRILTRAVERGYFETPREVSIEELAESLGIPESTASYRLRRATAQLAKQYADQYKIHA